jgi:hypothetical protein
MPPLPPRARPPPFPPPFPCPQWSTPLPVDVGEHEIIVTAPGRKRSVVALRVTADGARFSLVVRPLEVEAAQQPTYRQPLPPTSAPFWGPQVLDLEEDEPVLPGYHLDTRIRTGPVAGGASLLGSLYLITIFVGLLAQGLGEDSSSAGPLFFPALGPFIAIGSLQASGAGSAFLVLDGVLQSGGVALIIYGIAAPRKVQVRNDLGKLSVKPVPMVVGGTSPGVGLVGTF